jgi:hypothetical protein
MIEGKQINAQMDQAQNAWITLHSPIYRPQEVTIVISTKVEIQIYLQVKTDIRFPRV